MPASAARVSGSRPGLPAAVPCAARPSTGFVHPDGACRCFVGGPPPEFAPSIAIATAPEQLMHRLAG